MTYTTAGKLRSRQFRRVDDDGKCIDGNTRVYLPTEQGMHKTVSAPGCWDIPADLSLNNLPLGWRIRQGEDPSSLITVTPQKILAPTYHSQQGFY